MAYETKDEITLDFFITVVGFGLCRAWIIFCLGAPLVAGATMSHTWLYLAFGALSALVVAFVVKRDGRRARKTRYGLFRITPVALVVGGVMISLAIGLDSEALLACGFVVGGVGAGPLQVLWGDRFAQYRIRFAMFASPAAAVVTALVAGLSTEAGFIGFAVIPVVSYGLLVFVAHRNAQVWYEITHRFDEGEQTYEGVAESSVSAVSEKATGDVGASSGEKVGLGLGKLMFSIMVFSFLCRMFDATPVSDDPFSLVGGSAIFALIVVGVVFIGIVAKLQDRFNPTVTYRLSLPIMVAGFVAIALLFDTHAAISILLINVGYEFFDILAWVLFADVSRREQENPLHVFGLGVTFMFAGMALGTATGGAIDMMVVNGDVQITVVAMMATLCLVTVAFMVFPEGVLAQLSSTMRMARKDKETKADVQDDAAENSFADESTQTGRIEQHCAMVAKDFGLTPREGEVIVLLAYGRTLSIIARDLQIAKGTARTHIENIYRKLDVHKQQELIDLVESYGSEITQRAS